MAKEPAELFTATLRVAYTKDEVRSQYDKIESPYVRREMVDITVTATSLEKLQEKLNAHVGLLEL